jgi:hypothetical protein
MADFLLQSRRERVVTLTLNRPEARNGDHPDGRGLGVLRRG